MCGKWWDFCDEESREGEQERSLEENVIQINDNLPLFSIFFSNFRGRI